MAKTKTYRQKTKTQLKYVTKLRNDSTFSNSLCMKINLTVHWTMINTFNYDIDPHELKKKRKENVADVELRQMRWAWIISPQCYRFVNSFYTTTSGLHLD